MNNTQKSKMVTALIFGIIVLIFGIVSTVSAVRTKKRCTERVTAVVTDVRERTVTKKKSNGTRKRSKTYTYQISYEYEGSSYSSSLGYKSSHKTLNKGDKTEIYIDPKDPDTFYSEKADKVFNGICTSGLGILVLLIGIFGKKKDAF